MGSLAEAPLPALLVGLHRDAFGGGLVLSRASLSKRFEWRRGVPVGVSSRLPAEKLCQILAESGALEREARARVEQWVLEHGCSELQALAGQGGVAPRAVVLALTEQLRRSLGDCLGWRDGEFRLEPGEAPGAAPALPFDLLALVAEEVGRSWAPHDVLVALGPHALSFPTLVGGRIGSIHLQRNHPNLRRHDQRRRRGRIGHGYSGRLSLRPARKKAGQQGVAP